MGTTDPIKSWNIGPNNNPQGVFPVTCEVWQQVSEDDEYFFNAGQMQGNLASNMELRTQVNSVTGGIYPNPGAEIRLWREVQA